MKCIAISAAVTVALAVTAFAQTPTQSKRSQSQPGNSETVSAQTPPVYIWLSAECKYLEEAKTLLKANHKLAFTRDQFGEEPLHYAARSDCEAMVELLLANHADINAKDSAGSTPLHGAVGENREEMVQFLLANHADANQKNTSGYTPLQTASLHGYKGMVWSGPQN
jgi:ankyrin repeat protein